MKLDLGIILNGNLVIYPSCLYWNNLNHRDCLHLDFAFVCDLILTYTARSWKISEILTILVITQYKYVVTIETMH